jgi:hypothetical protein
MALFLLAVLVSIICGLRRRRSNESGSPNSPPPPRQSFPSVKVADVAFDYARAVLELDDVADVTKNRALWALKWMILPLAGEFPLDEVTPELQAGVNGVLAAELAGDNRAAVLVWNDLLRWGRIRVLQHQRRIG